MFTRFLAELGSAQAPVSLREYLSFLGALEAGAMSPYEITHPGGANEHWNAESGAGWLALLKDAWPRAIWINPLPEPAWAQTLSIGMIADAFAGEMYPLMLAGLDAKIRALAR